MNRKYTFGKARRLLSMSVDDLRYALKYYKQRQNLYVLLLACRLAEEGGMKMKVQLLKRQVDRICAEMQKGGDWSNAIFARDIDRIRIQVEEDIRRERGGGGNG